MSDRLDLPQLEPLTNSRFRDLEARLEAARDLAVVLADFSDAALALHVPIWGTPGAPQAVDFCRECDSGYPCATVKALTGADEDAA